MKNFRDFQRKDFCNVDSKNNFEMVYSIASYPQDGDTVEDLLFNAERFWKIIKLSDRKIIKISVFICKTIDF